MHFPKGFEHTALAFHVKCPPGYLEKLLRKDFFDGNSHFVQWETWMTPPRKEPLPWRLARGTLGNSNSS